MQTLAAILKRAQLRTDQTPGTWSDDDLNCRVCREPLDLDSTGREHRCCICRDAGRILTVRPVGMVGADARDVPGFGATTICTCQRHGVSEQEWLRRSGIPAELAGYTVESHPGSQGIVNAALRFATNWPPAPHLMLFEGAAGSGKSGMAVGILRVLWQEHGLVGRFVTAKDLMDRMRATFADEATETIEAIHAEYDRAPLIVLDDYGREGGTDFARREMFALINGRHHGGKPLIVTTNLSLTELDPAIKSRLVDVERCIRLDFGARDRREQ